MYVNDIKQRNVVRLQLWLDALFAKTRNIYFAFDYYNYACWLAWSHSEINLNEHQDLKKRFSNQKNF